MISMNKTTILCIAWIAMLLVGCKVNNKNNDPEPANDTKVTTTVDSTMKSNEQEKESSTKEIANDNQDSDFWDVKYTLVKNKKNQSKVLNRLFKATIGECYFESGIFKNKIVKNRMIELVGKSNYKFIVDTCNVTSPIEYFYSNFIHTGNVPHQGGEQHCWVCYDPDDDNMTIVIWRRGHTSIYWNKDSRQSSIFHYIKEMVIDLDQCSPYTEDDEDDED